mmetsp:Transcript_36322/g.61218  ORF Transcript_36322/g.61218 Transcript_36322/m.61218 type:complete len:315 (+) Transcript_36322:2388-3332(+)
MRALRADRLPAVVGRGNRDPLAGIHHRRPERNPHRGLVRDRPEQRGEVREKESLGADIHLEEGRHGDVGHEDLEGLGCGGVTSGGLDKGHSGGVPRDRSGHRCHSANKRVPLRSPEVEKHADVLRPLRLLTLGGVDHDGLCVDPHIVDQPVEEAPRDALPVVILTHGEVAIRHRMALRGELLRGLVVHVEVALAVGGPAQRHQMPLVHAGHRLEDGEGLQDVVVVVHEALPVVEHQRVVAAGRALKRQHRAHCVRRLVRQKAATLGPLAGDIGEQPAAIGDLAGLRRHRARGVLSDLALLNILTVHHVLGVDPE